jgi:hypothetical protein
MEKYSIKEREGNFMFNNEPISFEVTEELAVLSVNPKGVSKEVNMVSWNGRPAKLEVREWTPNHERGYKGVTFTDDEAIKLRDALIKKYGLQ